MGFGCGYETQNLECMLISHEIQILKDMEMLTNLERITS